MAGTKFSETPCILYDLAQIMWCNKGVPGQVHKFLLVTEYNHYLLWPRLPVPRPLFHTWQANMEADDIIRIHAIFDDTQVVPLTGKEIQEIANNDHDYVDIVPATQDVMPTEATTSDAFKRKPEAEEITNESADTQPPSTLLLYSNDQPEEDSYPVPGQKDPVISSPVHTDQGYRPAPVGKSSFHPAGSQFQKLFLSSLRVIQLHQS